MKVEVSRFNASIFEVVYADKKERAFLRRDRSEYDVIMATVKLRQASGTLKPDDLGDLNKLLAAPAK